MPRKDPMTGCMVMTMTEYWNSVGEAEGKTGTEVMTEFFQELDKDTEMWIGNIKKNIIEETCKLVTELNEDAEEKIPQPLWLTGEPKVSGTQGFAKNGWQAEFDAFAIDLATYHYKVTCFHYSGTMWEPPDEDINVEFERAK